MAKIRARDWSEEFKRWADSVGKSAKEVEAKMCQAGGEVAKKALKATSMWADDTGDLRKSIDASDPKWDSLGRCAVHVYPMGENADGERYATIGFILEHGRTGRKVEKKRGKKKGKTYVVHPMPPRPWMSTAVDESWDRIGNAMNKEWQKLKAKG